ncbi:unnamed protein product [Effrenium voratum]|nr:unnamed protein product [Effrenium voratum]
MPEPDFLETSIAGMTSTLPSTSACSMMQSAWPLETLWVACGSPQACQLLLEIGPPLIDGLPYPLQGHVPGAFEEVFRCRLHHVASHTQGWLQHAASIEV